MEKQQGKSPCQGKRDAIRKGASVINLHCNRTPVEKPCQLATLQEGAFLSTVKRGCIKRSCRGNMHTGCPLSAANHEMKLLHCMDKVV